MNSLNEYVESFLTYKHSLGYQYDTGERHIRNLVKFMTENYPDVIIPTKDCIDHFLVRYQGQTGGLYNVLAAVREFERYLNMLGNENVYVVPAKQMPKLVPEAPYFFTAEEIESFFAGMDSFFKKNHNGSKGRQLVIPAMFRLIHCCGLRPKEARTLLLKDMHLQEGYFDVLQSKGPKNRRIYASEDLMEYMSRYNMIISGVFPERQYFFPRTENSFYSEQLIDYAFRCIWKYSFPDFDGKYPRVYDLRHYFAWTNINGWVREEKDVYAMLPYLMHYMGHNCIKHTLYYFRFVPDFYNDYAKLANVLNDRIPEVEYDFE